MLMAKSERNEDMIKRKCTLKIEEDELKRRGLQITSTRTKKIQEEKAKI